MILCLIFTKTRKMTLDSVFQYSTRWPFLLMQLCGRPLKLRRLCATKSNGYFTYPQKENPWSKIRTRCWIMNSGVASDLAQADCSVKLTAQISLDQQWTFQLTSHDAILKRSTDLNHNNINELMQIHYWKSSFMKVPNTSTSSYNWRIILHVRGNW